MNIVKKENLPSAGNEYNREKLAALKKMKIFATLLFCLMFALFLLSSFFEKEAPLFSYLKAFSEAGMVGALADWFAVVALFKHPFGIPIPHTAIISRNKNNIGKSLANFIEVHFLNEKVINEKIRSSNPTMHAAEWLIKDANRKAILENIRTIIPEIFGILKNEEIKQFLIKNLKDNLKNLNFSELLKNLLESLTKNNQHEKWIKAVINEVRKLLNKNKEYIREKVENETPWWTFGFLDNKIYNKIITGVDNFIEDFESNNTNKFRLELDTKITKFINDLSGDEKLIARVEDFKNNLIENEELTGYIAAFIDDIAEKLNDDISSDNSGTLKLVNKSIKKFAENLKVNSSVQNKLNDFIIDIAVKTISSNADKLSSVITDTIEKWDEKEISRELEIQIGKDLQFIRINGTLVGGLVGVVIFVISKII